MKPDEKISKRVFCVGMNKTGTSTMRKCFEALALTPVATPTTLGHESLKRVRRFYKDRNYEPVLKLAEHYRTFEDRPWNMWEMYRHLDRRFPDSLFILTLREPESWWRSTERWITVSKPAVLGLYQLHLRVPRFSKESMIDSYLRYNEEVIRYFKGSGKLLQLDLEAGQGWEELCQFLDLPVPERAFPHVNRQTYGPEDAALLERRHLLEHGVVCQACGHLTPTQDPAEMTSSSVVVGAGAGGARARAARLARKVARFSRRRVRPRLAIPVKGMLYNLHRVSHSLNRALLDVKPRPGGPQRVAPDGRELAVVSCFFNPGGSRSRVINFKRFLAAMTATGVRCLVVELAFGTTPFLLEEGDDAIRLRTCDVMWHKERLLNIGISQLLAEGYRKIAWLDGDVTFDDPGWPRLVADQLNTVKLCQVFSTVAIEEERNRHPLIGPSAVKYFLENKRFYTQTPWTLPGMLLGRSRIGQSGFGWAARAEVLEEVKLFDKAIVGGADRLMLAACLSDDHADARFVALTHSGVGCGACGHLNRSEAYTRCFMDWARRWAAAVDGQVGYADLRIRDMYHGWRGDRRYMARRDILCRHQFDPAEDLADDAAGCLAWDSDKIGLHDDVESYFLSRREDL